MTGLTHDQARRNLHAAADKCLNPKERTALEAHLAECAPCRAYADEISWLNAAIARALRGRWAVWRCAGCPTGTAPRPRSWAR